MIRTCSLVLISLLVVQRLGVVIHDCFSRLCVDDRFFGVSVLASAPSWRDSHREVAPTCLAANLGDAYGYGDQRRTCPRLDRSAGQPDPHISARGRERACLLRGATKPTGAAGRICGAVRGSTRLSSRTME